MSKKKLPLKNLKVKSSVTVMSKSEQKTAKGGYVNMKDNYITVNTNWTSVKTQKEPDPIVERFNGSSKG